MEKNENHFRELAQNFLLSEYEFFCKITSNEMLLFGIKKDNVVSTINEFPVFMDDAFFLEHLEFQKQAIDKYFIK